MVELRFPGTVMNNGWLDFGGATGGWSPFVLAASTFMAALLEQARIYVAPGRYSEVRKVIFTITFQHMQTGGTLATTFRARIGPSSLSNTDRVNLESNTISPSARLVTFGSSQIWANAGPQADAAFYALTGSENQVAPRQVAFPRVVSGSQICTVEFDRTVDTDFFTDWDEIAALGDDEYMAYAAAIQRDDGGVFTGALGDVNNVPTIIGLQMAVIQAPSATNDSCTHINATNGLFPDESMNGALFNPGKGFGFKFNAADWDGLTAIHVLLRQTSRTGAIAEGHFQLQIFEIFDNTNSANMIFTQDFTPNVTNVTMVFRSSDLLGTLVDGMTYLVFFISLSGSANQDLPWGWWEITQKSCSKKAVYHCAGMGNPANAVSITPGPPTSIGDFRWSVDQSMFDPNWYQNYPLSFILERRFWAGFRHLSPNDTDMLISVNPSITADIPVAGDNQSSDEVSSTPDASSGRRIRSFDITPLRIDPLTLTGQQALKLRYNRDDWTTSSPDEVPGLCGFQYVIFVPASEFFNPELGPLFEVGTFDPKGCVSTSAGLGDSPGILVITNGSVIPKKFNPVAMVVENAGIDTPYRDQEPSASFISVALSPDGGLTPGIYRYRYTLRNACTQKESDPNPVDIVVDVSAASPAAEVTLNFAGIQIPADNQIDQICIYRTVLGGDFPVMAKVGCFDIPGTTIFVDILSDSVLDFINDPLDTFNAPMPCVAVVEEFRNRLWGLVDIPDLNPPGTVAVTFDSEFLQGDQDTQFDRCILGKFIQIQGDCTAYEVIECLLPVSGLSPLQGMQLRLDRPYEGTTDSNLNFIVCGHPNRVYISEPLEGECWPLINFLDVDPGDGDALVGASSNFNRLLICKRRKTYVVAFREQPIIEIVVPTLIGRDIGCISGRSFAQIASGTVWLSDRGLALYDGRGVHQVPESSVMNDLFVNPDNPNYLRRDENGLAVGAAGVFYPRREQYLLLLPTVKTTRGASMILVWDTELRNVTLLEFCQEFLSIELAKDSDGNERIYLGDSNGFVWIWDVGDTDGVGFPNATGTVRGTITAAGIEPSTGASFLDDSAASFLVGGIPGLAGLSGLSGLSGLTGLSNLGLAGACVFFRPANAPLDTPWKSRFIYTSNSTRLFVTPNWGPDTPSATDEYMIGPIEFRAQFKPANYGTDDFTKRDWRQIVVHEREAVSTMLRTELLRDFQNSDVDEDTVTDKDGATGEGRNYDLGFGQGRQIRPVGRLIHNFMGVRLSNFAPDEPLTIINHLLAVIPRQSK